VREELVQRHVPHGPQRLRVEAHQGVGDAQPAVVLQGEDGRGGELLGDGRDVEHRPRRDRRAGDRVGHACADRRLDPVAAQDEHGAGPTERDGARDVGSGHRLPGGSGVGAPTARAKRAAGGE
jgi:hypothetical protein